MLSVKKCKEVLNKSGTKYTIDEVLAIRESLYLMAEIIYNSKTVSNEKFSRKKGNII